jgi:hypothetical protein
MNRRWPQALIMASGLLLIVIGVLAIGAQMLTELQPQTQHALSPPPQTVAVSRDQLTASTRFVGLELVLVGALLEIVGYVATLPWRSPEKAS